MNLSVISTLRIISTLTLWLIVAVCCILPLGWLAIQVGAHPTTLIHQLRLDSFRAALLGRTLLYNVSVGIIATLIALPAAWELGRGRGRIAAALWFVLPISLLMPSLVIAYGWKQFIRGICRWFEQRYGIDLELAPGGFWDICRCIWTLATWLWPVPAIAIGLALRRSDPQIQQQAVLDGILRRVMLRQVLGPLIASVCIVSMLAMQEFAVYEPTGISVVATETRMVFETGAFSSSLNPIVAPMTGTATSLDVAEQAARAAGAIGTAVPMLGVVLLLGTIAWVSARRLSAAEQVELGAWPRVLDVPAAAVVLSWLAVLVTLGIPLVSLILSLHKTLSLSFMWNEYQPQAVGTLLVAGTTGIVAMLLALCATPKLARGAFVVALLTFLIGGQILAISLIWVYNHPWPVWMHKYVYNRSPSVVIMAYIGRFGWIVLGAAMMTWSQAWRQLRDLAAIDGADSMQTTRYVVWPLAWPILGAASLFVLILSLSEVPATVLISPQHPQVLVPMLMTWVHMLRYDAMIEASLLIAGLVIALGAAAITLGFFGIRLARLLPLLLIVAMLTGCWDRAKPQAIWCSTGVGPAQVVYPRGIAYSKSDDSFFIVDREARIQHLDHNGQYIAGWRMPVWEQGKPVGLSVSPDGDLFVPDTHYHRVLVYKPDGSGPTQVWGSKGTDPGQFIYPTDIAFDSAGHVFISEYGDNDRIQVFDRDGKFLYKFGKFGDAPGEFSRPQAMVIVGNDLYITDSCNHRIQVFKTDGTFVRVMGKAGSELGQFRFPYGLDIDSNGHLVVCEFGNNRVQLIDKETGKGIATWGTAGREPGELAYPWGVAVDKHGRVVAVDAGNNRLQVFEF